MNLLARALQQGIRTGQLTVAHADGTTARYGDGDGPAVTIRFTETQAELALALDPAMKLGELYMDGRLQLEQGDCYDLVATLKRNARHFTSTPGLANVPAAVSYAARHLAARVMPRQTVAEAEANIAHHYDLDERLYRLFLDDDLQYTCAYFERPGQSLEGAQLAKKRHVTAKLMVEPGQRVLDIGSGWGGLALYLAQVAGADVTGVTLSAAQHRVSVARAAERGLAQQVRFQRSDYRDVQGTFDRIVSVGMFEAIGRKDFDVFFQTAARLLAPKGVFVLHAIGRTRPNRVFSPWIEKYIFPGGYIPALSEVLPALERAGFLVGDLEVLRHHYADTLKEWRRRFLARRAEVRALFDDRFVRMFDFYLAGSEAGFRVDRMFIFQLQLTRHQSALPIRRDYLAERAAALRTVEAAHPPYAFETRR